MSARRVITILLLAWALVPGAGDAGAANAAGAGPRVVILGFDGMDPLLLRQYLDEGALPNFRRFLDQGA